PREQTIHPPIRLVVAAAVGEEAEHEVKQRPERVVAVARVVAGEISFVDVDRREAHVAGRREPCRPRLSVDRLAAPAEPETALLLKRGHQTDREPTGGFAATRYRHPIRHGDDATHRPSLIVSEPNPLCPK